MARRNSYLPHFEIVRSKRRTIQPWFARVVACNGKELWRTSETYRRQRGAKRAVDALGLGLEIRVRP